MFGTFAPANTSSAIVSRVNQEIVKVVSQGDVKEKFLNAGFEAVGSSPEQFAQFLKDDLEKYARIAKAAGIKPE